jgi:hypothetical protein
MVILSRKRKAEASIGLHRAGMIRFTCTHDVYIHRTKRSQTLAGKYRKLDGGLTFPRNG